MTAPKVLISDKLSATAVQIFKDRGLDVTFEPDLGKDKDKLREVIGQFDGLAIRSATKVTDKILEAADNLKVIGRAGIGVDNVDKKAATAKGVIVMNTPFGNSITTGEHAISLMMALARQIPQANASTHAGKWEKSKFMGVELFNKTLGVIGCGNIGSIVATRALGLKMRVVAYDPYLSEEGAIELGVEKVSLEDLLKRADFITFHTPLTEATRGLLNAERLAQCKKGVRIINCARGGLIDETALAEAIDAGHVAGAALDVFETEPATENVLFGKDNVICTPHLGASTSEAQENVAVQVAEQMSDYLLKGAITNAINFPSISAEEAPKLTPFVKLAEQLGSFAGQLTDRPIKAIKISYCGEVAELNVKPMTAVAVAGALRPLLADINMVSAKDSAEKRGILIEESRRGHEGIYESYIKFTIVTDEYERSVAGTVFSDGRPRFIQVRDINMDFEVTPQMLFVRHQDRPGFIGDFGQTMAQQGINIATLNLGRTAQSGDAIMVAALDSVVTPEALDAVCKIDRVVRVKSLTF